MKTSLVDSLKKKVQICLHMIYLNPQCKCLSVMEIWGYWCYYCVVIETDITGILLIALYVFHNSM